MMRSKQPRCIVAVRGPDDRRLTVGPFASTHSATDYQARLRKSAVRHGVATRVHSEIITLEPPIPASNLRDLGLIDDMAPLPE
jgi:hypothetical protein